MSVRYDLLNSYTHPIGPLYLVRNLYPYVKYRIMRDRIRVPGSYECPHAAMRSMGFIFA